MTINQKHLLFFLFIILIISISSCKVKVQNVSTLPPSAEKHEQLQTAPEPQPTPASEQKIADANSVKCDGTAYNLLVKSKHSMLLIYLESSNKEKLAEIKTQGLIEELAEVIKNEGNLQMPIKGATKVGSSKGAFTSSLAAGQSLFMADLKKENYEAVAAKVKEIGQNKIGSGYSGYGIISLNDNYGDKDETFEFKCRIPTGPGRITLYSNIPEASFSIDGPAKYSGSGLCWTTFDAPAGKYKIIWNDVAGYTAPGKIPGFVSASSQMTMELPAEGHLKLGGTYRKDTRATTGIIIVITNLPEATFKISGPTSYSGSGTCWSQTNVPLGQYEVNFNDVAGYELPSSFDKRKTVFISENFNLQTAEAEYKKIGEES